MITELVETGVNYFRLNFSHGDQDTHRQNIERIREVSRELKRCIGILADLQGPKIRVGEIEGGEIELNKGDILTITTEEMLGNKDRVSTTYIDLPTDVNRGDRFLLDDGLLTFEVKSSDENTGEIICEVIYGGLLKSKKGINLPDVELSAPSLTEHDRENAIFAADMGVDFFALSFVRRSADVSILKDLIKARGKKIPVIAKIERQEALDDFDQILDEADGIMIARGDLGVELAPERVPMLQKIMIRKCNIAGKPVITATQMLESMIQNPRPTRAEVSDVANTILDGSDAIMLSGETAVGKYPLKAVQKMVDIAKEIEMTSPVLFTRKHGKNWDDTNDIDENIALVACETARNLKARAIIAWTQNGGAIRLLSKFHPVCPIIAFTTSDIIARRVEMMWGAISRTVNSDFDLDEDGLRICKELLGSNNNKYKNLVIVAETMDPVARDKMNSVKILSL